MPLLYKPCSDGKPGGALCGGRDSRGPPVSHPLPQAGRQGQTKEDSRYAAFSQGGPDGSPGKNMDPSRRFPGQEHGPRKDPFAHQLDPFPIDLDR